jgi:hypothetical protein
MLPGEEAADLLLAVSPNGRYLVDGNGNPFFCRGESAWNLLTQLAGASNHGSASHGPAASLTAGQNTYLDVRAGQGVNAILLMPLTRYSDTTPNDHDGAAPFSTPGDFTTFNATFWNKLGNLVGRAADRGMLCVVAFAWAGYDSQQGFESMILDHSEAECQDFAESVGTILEPHDNVVYMLGGDRPPTVPSGLVDRYVAMATGLRAVDTRHLITGHWNFAPGDSPTGDWEDIVSCYDWGASLITQIASEYAENDAPLWIAESLYELNTPFGWNRKVGRVQYISGVLSGALGGNFYGHEGVWHLGSTNNSTLGSQSQGHPYDLNSPGFHDQRHISDAIESVEWWTFVPDTGNALVTSSRGSGLDYISAARGANHGIVCVPTATNVTCNLAVFGGARVCRWFDPTTGGYTTIGTLSGSQEFTHPGDNASGDADWLLILET